MARIPVRVDLDSSEAERSVNDLKGRLDRLDPTDINVELNTDEAQGNVGSLLSSLGKIPTPIAAGVAAAAALGTALLKVGAAGFNAALEIGKLADQALTTTDRIQEFQSIAARIGGDVQALVDGQRELRIRLGELASHGAGPAKDALESLGLTLEDLGNMTPEQQMDFLIERLLEVEDTSQRVFLAEELLGGQFAENSRILNLTSEEYANVAEKAEGSRKASEENIAAIERLNNWFQEAKRTVTTFVTDALGFLIRQFEALPQIINAVFRHIGNGLEAFVNFFIQGINTVISITNDLITGLNKIPGVNVELINSIRPVNFEWSVFSSRAKEAGDAAENAGDAALTAGSDARASESGWRSLGGVLRGVETDIKGVGSAILGLNTAATNLDLANLGLGDVVDPSVLRFGNPDFSNFNTITDEPTPVRVTNAAEIRGDDGTLTEEAGENAFTAEQNELESYLARVEGQLRRLGFDSEVQLRGGLAAATEDFYAQREDPNAFIARGFSNLENFIQTQRDNAQTAADYEQFIADRDEAAADAVAEAQKVIDDYNADLEEFVNRAVGRAREIDERDGDVDLTSEDIAKIEQLATDDFNFRRNNPGAFDRREGGRSAEQYITVQLNLDGRELATTTVNTVNSRTSRGLIEELNPGRFEQAARG